MFTRNLRLLPQLCPIVKSACRSYSDNVRRRAIRVLSAAEAENFGKHERLKQEEYRSNFQDNPSLDHDHSDHGDILPEGMSFEKLNEVDKRLK